MKNSATALVGVCVVSSILSAAPARAEDVSANRAQWTKTERTSTRYPNAIVVLGHSGATGFDSNPAHSSKDAPENSWATGTNPAVKSIYLRILAENPSVRGHNVNLARDGAMGEDLRGPARIAVALAPQPELALVQIGENDFACDGREASHYAAFRAELEAALDTLAKGLPNARIFVASAWGSEHSYVKILKGLSRYRRLMQAGNSPCAEISAPSGQIVPARVAYMKNARAGHEAQKAAACAEFRQCRYDRGAASGIALRNADVTSDLQHPTIQGHAKLAAVE